MNNSSCPNCKQSFTFSNPPKKLKNCQHSMCDSCLPIALKCPIDNKKIDFRRFTAKGFELNHTLLQQIDKQCSQMQPDSPRKTKSTIQKQSTPKKQYQICLLHSKPADLICTVDCTLICSNCALFGEHRGHPVQNCQQFLHKLTHYTQQALQIFDKLKQKQDNLNPQVISSYLDDCFQQQKNQQIKNIKAAFTKLIEKVKKVQKVMITRLDAEVKARKEILMRQVAITELETKKEEWYREVEALGGVMGGLYQWKGIGDAVRYLDQKSSESFLVKRGEYLQLEYSSSQNVIKNKIDIETAKLTCIINQSIDKALDQYITFAGAPQKRQSQPFNKLNESNISAIEKKIQQDILIDQMPSRIQLSDSGYRREIYLKPEIENKSGYIIGIKIPEVTIAESIHPHPEFQPPKRSKSIRQASTSSTSNRQILTPSQADNKKRKKPEIPQKYKAIFQDLKNDRCQLVDFGGAQLGDQCILSLCQYIQKTTKLRTLKLVRNKLTDQVIKQLLNACYSAKVTSLNLGQNMLTERTLDLLESYDIGELRNVTLSLNKINRRNVKGRLEEFAKRGITLSI